nr:EOG090X07VJ [Lepidurus arcticus]
MKITKSALKKNIIKRKYFKTPISPNLVTWAEKEYLKYLHKSEPQTWSVAALAENFGITTDAVKKIIRSNWRPESEKRITKHDSAVARRRQILGLPTGTGTSSSSSIALIPVASTEIDQPALASGQFSSLVCRNSNLNSVKDNQPSRQAKRNDPDTPTTSPASQRKEPVSSGQNQEKDNFLIAPVYGRRRFTLSKYMQTLEKSSGKTSRKLGNSMRNIEKMETLMSREWITPMRKTGVQRFVCTKCRWKWFLLELCACFLSYILCKRYNVNAEAFVEHWLAFSTSRLKNENPSEVGLDLLEKEVLNKVDTSSHNRNSRVDISLTSNSSFHEFIRTKCKCLFCFSTEAHEDHLLDSYASTPKRPCDCRYVDIAMYNFNDLIWLLQSRISSPSASVISKALLAAMNCNHLFVAFSMTQCLPVPSLPCSPLNLQIPDGETLQIVVASGPYTFSDELSYAPLTDFLSYVVQNKPHVCVLIGPFVDIKNKIIENGDLDVTYHELFVQLMDRVVSALDGLKTQVILVSSSRDAHHDVIYPTPPYLLTQSLGTNFHVVPDPCVVDIAGLKMGLTATDVLFHLGKEEIALAPAGSDRLGRLAAHLLKQRTFYPLFPANDEVSLDLHYWEQRAIITEKPHFMVLPSDLRMFVKEIEECVVVNPERLCKGSSGGSFARLQVDSVRGIQGEILRI